MFSRSAKLLLVSTSFSPVLLTLAFVRAVNGKFMPVGLGYVVAAGLLIVACLTLIHAAATQLQILPFRVKSMKTADQEVLAFVLAYLLPFAGSGGQIKTPVLGFVLLLIFTVVWTTHSYHCNPVLGIFGYHFYEVTADSNVTFIMITRRTLRGCQSVTKVVQLTDYMVLDIDERRIGG